MSDLTVNQQSTEEQLGKKAEDVIRSKSFDFDQEPPWLKHARTCLNLTCESNISFVNTMLKSCNLKENSNKTFPISFASYGKNCDYRPGAILVFDEPEHVGIIETVDGEVIQIISCHHNKICLTDASEHGKIISCRRPDNFVL